MVIKFKSDINLPNCLDNHLIDYDTIVYYIIDALERILFH